jgi:hypothetical protein
LLLPCRRTKTALWWFQHALMLWKKCAPSRGWKWALEKKILSLLKAPSSSLPRSKRVLCLHR